MRFAMVLAAACLCWHAVSLAVAQQFPHTANISMQAPYYGQAEVSGLPAGQLPAGASVEVYRHDGQWLAIRPPAGSFSWISSRDVEATDQPDVVKAKADGAICWIGHQGSQSRTLSQLTLNRGELLQVHGDSLIGDESEVQQWYKVVPPAGEFRFIHTRHIAAPLAVSPAPIGTGVATTPINWSARTNPLPVATNAAPAVQQGVAAPPASTPAPSAPSIPTTPISTSPADTVKQRLAEIDQQLTTMLAYPPNRWNPMAVAPELQTWAASAPTAELRQQANVLWAKATKSQQVQQGYANVAASFQASVQPVSAIAAPLPGAPLPATPPPQQVRSIENAGYYVATPSPYAQGPLHVSPEFRPLAPRNLIARVRQAAYNVGGIAQPEETTSYGRVAEGDGATLTSDRPQLIDAPVDENGYAGKGWLMPLVARSQMPLKMRSGVPPLALTDDEGNVKFLVTPSTGTSLREYLRKEVGVIGPVSQLPDLETPHITADRVVVLQRHE